VKLLELETEGVLGAPDGRYEFATPKDEAHPVTLITGGPASGKSSLLRAVVVAKEALGPYASPLDPKAATRVGASEAKLRTRWRLDATEQQALAPNGEVDGEAVPVLEVVEVSISIRGAAIGVETTTRGIDVDALGWLFGQYDADPGHAKFELFPARRHVDPALWRELPGELDAVREASLRLSEDPSKYGFVRRLFFDLVLAEGMRMQHILATDGVLVPNDDLDLLAPYKRALASFTDDLRLDHVEAGKAGATLVWFARRDGRRVELAQLSDSETQAVLFSSTMLRQGLNDSLILIDTPELHIPEAHQVPFFGSVVGIGAGNQVIAATTSSRILAEMGANIIDLGT